ncbi:MAG: hypothetical protein QM589_06020 [Thermomicrobiales bacterium]
MTPSTDTLFIASSHRPDLRAAFSETPGTDPQSSCIATLPRPLLFSGCNEKSDKADKTKEVGKDDKSNRAPVRDRRAGQCTYLAGPQQLDAPVHDFVFS